MKQKSLKYLTTNKEMLIHYFSHLIMINYMFPLIEEEINQLYILLIKTGKENKLIFEHPDVDVYSYEI